MLMKDQNKYKLLPNTDTHNCFACGPNNPAGLRMKFFTDEESIVSWTTVPEHLCGWDNVVHGGIISTILDEIMSWTGIYLLKKITMTKSMTVDFKKALFVGNELRVEGKVVDTDNRHEAVIEGAIYNHKGELCAKAIGAFAMISPAVAKRLGVINEEIIRDFLEPLIGS